MPVQLAAITQSQLTAPRRSALFRIDPTEMAAFMPITADAALALAEAYTTAWNSGSAANVAAFYAPDGQIVINGGAPWMGRDGVAAMAQGFFNDVPDLALTCDGVRVSGDHMIYLWTFTGHHAATTNPLKITGWEEWDLTADHRVQTSRGCFDGADYARQVAGA